MTLLKRFFFSIFFAFLLFIVNGFEYKCNGFWRRPPCKLVINVKYDKFLPKAKASMLLADYNKLQLAWYQRHNKPNALLFMNKFASYKLDQKKIKWLCEVYKIKYKNPTYILLIDTPVRSNSLKYNDNRGSFRRSRRGSLAI